MNVGIRGKISVLVIAAAIVLVAVLLSARQGVQSTATPVRSMPPLTALVTTTSQNSGQGGRFDINRTRLIYLDRSHWRTELVSHEGRSEGSILPGGNIGSWAQYDGKSMTSYDPGFGLSTLDLSKESSVQVPLGEWFNDFYIYKLETRVREIEAGRVPGDIAVIDRSDGLRTLRYSYRYDCPPKAEGYGSITSTTASANCGPYECPSIPAGYGSGAGLDSADCRILGDALYTEEITFRAADYLPVEIMGRADGVVTSRIQIELSFQIDPTLLTDDHGVTVLATPTLMPKSP